MSRREEPSSSDLKLPSGPSARRRRSVKDNAWMDQDKSERRRPIFALAVVGAILLAGLVLIIAGFGS